MTWRRHYNSYCRMSVLQILAARGVTYQVPIPSIVLQGHMEPLIPLLEGRRGPCHRYQEV